MNWTQVGRFLRTLFLLRVPLITLVLLAVAGPLAFTVAESLLGNLFDVRVVQLDASGASALVLGRTAWYLFSVSLAAFLTALAAVTAINLVTHYGRDRFDDPALDLQQKRPLITFLSGLGCALSFVICTAFRSQGEIGGSWRLLILWLMPACGLVAALLLAILAKVVQLIFTDPRTTPHPPPYLIFPVFLIRPLERLLDELYCWNAKPVGRAKRFLNKLSQWPLEIFRCAGQGYLIDCNAPPGQLQLRSGHVFALAHALLALSFYLGIGYAKGKIDEKPATVPALAFLLLFAIVLCWSLSAFTFFLDRYRVPLLSGIAILSLTTTFSPQSDHVYRVEHRGTPFRMEPADVVQSRAAGGKKRLILVATAGGGIQAAAWTARVLRGLEEECANTASQVAQQQNQQGCNFRDSVVLISGVSGGSLGAMAYARSFAQSPVPVDPSEVPRNAAQPALDEVGWAWTNPDVGRTVLPWFRTQYIDRGWALEEKWSAVHKLYVRHRRTFLENVGWTNRGVDTFLGDWAKDVQNGMPALLLNATLVERGQPLVFSSTDFPRKGDPRGLQDFYSLYGDVDIRVTTAARLSASFPYVAPAARSNAKAVTVGDDHVVDGGYYDNYGINSLLGWLEDAISHMPDASLKQSLSDILILQIRPFADPGIPAPHEGGWSYQVSAPLDGLLDVRNTGQLARDRTELALFAKAYAQKIHVWRADFVYPANFDKKTENCVHAPLSWKLSYEQTQCIKTAWEKLVQDNDALMGHGQIGCVLQYLRNQPIVDRRSIKDLKQQTDGAVCIAGDDFSETGAQP